MKYSFFKSSISLAALGALMLGSCSSELKDEPKGDDEAAARLYVRVAVAPPASGDSDESTDAERMIDPSRLFLATYKTDGTLIETFYAGADTNNAKFYGSVGGSPEVAAYLDAEKHESGFVVVAYALPSSHYTLPGGGFAALENIKSDNYTLTMPGLSTNPSTLWLPSNATTGGDQIPMCGRVEVTTTDLANYDPVVHRYSPYRLPDIEMTRAMAKIVIEDTDGIIEKAELRITDQGYLVPATSMWWDGGVKCAIEPGGTNGATITSVNEVKPTDGKIEFYAFERDLKNRQWDNARRTIAILTGVSGMNPATKEIRIAPYDEKGQQKELSATELQTEDDGVWSGLLRNHEYHFTVKKPANGEMEIYVNVGKWTVERKPFEF